jgi:hypothetical protein
MAHAVCNQDIFGKAPHMELNELLQGAGQPGITAAIEAALMRDGYLLFSGERLQAVHDRPASAVSSVRKGRGPTWWLVSDART